MVEPEILLSINNWDLRNLAKTSLEKAGCQVICASRTTDAIELIETSDDLLVCLDCPALGRGQSGETGNQSDLVNFLSDIQARAPFVVLLEEADQRLAIDIMSKGARDCILYDDVYTGLFPYKMKHVLDQIAMEQRMRRELAACKVSNKSLVNFLDSFPGLAYRSLNDDRRTMLVLNKGCRNLTGYSPDELKHNALVSYIELVHEDDRRRVVKEIGQALSAQRPYDSVYRLRTREGRLKWVWEKGSAISLEKEDVEVLAGFVLDVTPQQSLYGHHSVQQTHEYDMAIPASVMQFRDPVAASEQMQFASSEVSNRHAEDALKASEDRFSFIAENARHGVIILQEGELRFVNGAMSSMTGYSDEELFGLSCDFWVQMTHDSSPRNGERSTRTTSSIKCKNGTVKEIELITVPTIYQRKSATLALLYDFSEQRTTDIKLHRALTDVARSTAELREFAHVSSHHLQEPIRQIISYVQLLDRHCRGRLDKEAEEFIEYAVDGARRLYKLMNDFLAYSAMSMRRFEYEPVDCNLILNKVMEDLQPTISEADATITSDWLPTLLTNHVQLQELLKHLIDNALKFRRDDPPQIHIKANRQDDTWLFTLEDNGLGIENEFLDKIFLIFNRLHGWNKYPGTGIGLPICKRIVEQHGGTIWADSEPGKGTRFFFTFPDMAEDAHGPQDNVEPWLDDILDVRIQL